MMKPLLALTLVPGRSPVNASAVSAQPPRPTVVSPEVTADRRIILRLHAPSAQQVVGPASSTEGRTR